MRLLLARHGQTVWNADRRFQGQADPELSVRGRAQAEALGRALRRRRLTAVYSSPLRRARETAEIVVRNRGLPITLLADLRELGLGRWEGRAADEVIATDGEHYRRWLSQPLACPPPGGEPLPDVSKRVLSAVDRIISSHPDGEELLVVGHGGIIGLYCCHLLRLSLNAVWRLRIDNASLTVVAPPRLLSFNETAHLKG
jgi:broad specificity phosphatase PhoE